MPDIDFLPIEYRQEHARRQVQPWRIVVVAVFAALVAGAFFAQYRRQHTTERELAGLVPSYDEAVRQNGLLATLQGQLLVAESNAQLCVYLRHPWPRTQLLAVVVAPLPREITLLQLQIGREAAPNEPPAEQRAGTDKKAEEEKLSKAPPAQRDLKRLRDELDRAATTVRITGTTTAPAALHRYLAALGKCDLFAKAELRSIESIESKQGLAVRFQALLIVRPGYGQPGGPGPAEKHARQAWRTWPACEWLGVLAVPHAGRVRHGQGERKS